MQTRRGQHLRRRIAGRLHVAKPRKHRTVAFAKLLATVLRPRQSSGKRCAEERRIRSARQEEAALRQRWIFSDPLVRTHLAPAQHEETILQTPIGNVHQASLVLVLDGLLHGQDRLGPLAHPAGGSQGMDRGHVPVQRHRQIDRRKPAQRPAGGGYNRNRERNRRHEMMLRHLHRGEKVQSVQHAGGDSDPRSSPETPGQGRHQHQRK